MSAAIQLGPGYEAPADVMVRGPGKVPTWRAPGRVVGRAPYSAEVAYASPEGERRAWFAWEPGAPNHGRMHGVPSDLADWIEAP